jgi:hypothetical protein
MEAGNSGMGAHKHGTSGHVHPNTHFTGRTSNPCGHAKRKRGKSRKQRRANRGSHVNKYAT